MSHLLNWHDLRGTFVTMCVDAGCSEFEVASITGHSVIKSSVGNYLGDSHRKKASLAAYEKLNKSFVQNTPDYFQISH